MHLLWVSEVCVSGRDVDVGFFSFSFAGSVTPTTFGYASAFHVSSFLFYLGVGGGFH